MKRLMLVCASFLCCILVVSLNVFGRRPPSSTEDIKDSWSWTRGMDAAKGVGIGKLRVGPLTFNVNVSLNHRETYVPTEAAPAVMAVISKGLKSVTLQQAPVPYKGTRVIISGKPEALSDLSIQNSRLTDPKVDLNAQIKSLSLPSLLTLPEELIKQINTLSLKALYDFDISFYLREWPESPVTTTPNPKTGGPSDQVGGVDVLGMVTDESQLARLAHYCLTVTLYRSDRSWTVLTKPIRPREPQTKAAGPPVCEVDDSISDRPAGKITVNDRPIVLVQVDGIPYRKDETGQSECAYVTPPAAATPGVLLGFQFGKLFEETCQVQYLVARKSAPNDELISAMQLAGSEKTPVLLCDRELQNRDPESAYFVNGDDKIIGRGEGFIGSPDGTWTIEWQKKSDSCRAVSWREAEYASLTLKAHVRPFRQVANGIVVGAPKVFDVATLQRMLNTTASQLAAISGFNASSINAAVGNLQGITRTTSYVNAQLSTAGTPSLTQQNTQSLNTPNTTQTTTPIGSTTVTLQCPDGSLPTIGTSTTLGGCAVVPVSGNTPNVPVYSPVGPGNSSSQGVLTTTPAGSTVTNTGSTTNNQNQTTVTTPSVSGVAPAALTATTLTPPSNVGVASADILAEQVQLNSQITMLQLLLEGALSDQYLVKNSRAVGKRQQTTLGFSVALDPVRQFKHAVAEIHVILIPTTVGRSAGPSIMNLLPSEKTYNVAKVTSSQKAFGGGAVIEPIAFGVSTGKSKDRLYLAKDTDTLALQFPLPLRPGDSETVETPLPQKVHDIFKTIIDFQSLGGCGWGTDYENAPQKMREAKEQMEKDVSAATVRGSQPIAFGWQFRPVLGADYVKGGERQVFAQLALDAGLNDINSPYVYVETVWRAYNPQSQVVGAIYKGSCSLTREGPGGVNVLTKPMVRKVVLDDLGGGQMKLSATGNFYSSSLSVLSSQNMLSALFYDGSLLEAFGSAHDLVEGGDLKIVGESGENAPFGISTNPTFTQESACGIATATARVAPRPDGNSRVYLDVTMGSNYRLLEDEEPKPLVLINGQVYGLRESPFVTKNCNAGNPPYIPAVCHYEFLAPTMSVRNGQTFLVRDLAWDKMRFGGNEQFVPSFTAAKTLSVPAAPVITVQPRSQEVLATVPKVTFTVAATNTLPGPLSYQWLMDDVEIGGATGASFTLPFGALAVPAGGNHGIAVRVRNAAGSTLSEEGVRLTVDAGWIAPVISKQPENQTGTLNGTATFSVQASGTGPLRYQWSKSNVAIVGATSPSYTLPIIKQADDGANFTVAVSNQPAGGAINSVPSLPVTLTVVPASMPVKAADSKKVETASYEISGYDLKKIAQPCPAGGGTLDLPCLRVYADSILLDDSNFTVLSDNLASLKNVAASTKSLWFEVNWNPGVGPAGDPTNPIVWELAVPKTTEEAGATIVGSPAFLHMGDTATVSFSSSSFSVFASLTSPIPITFNGTTLNGTYDANKKVLKVEVGTTITQILGHKELTVMVPPSQGSGNAQPVTLSFDVVKQVIKE
jgi:hypothetical protein